MVSFFSKIISIGVLFEVIYFVNSLGSLTFVIKNAKSMEEDIGHIKNKTEALFNAILGSNSTDIDHFILVNLDENGHPIWTKTRYPNEYRQALDNMPVLKNNTLHVTEAVQKALEISKQNSYLYVFTDASVKEDEALENCIKNLAIKKATQVTFVVKEESGDLFFYNELAAGTFGEVFNIKKQEIFEIIDYIIESRKHVRTIIRREILKPGLNQLKFTVDSKEWDVIVSAATDNATIDVTGPHGTSVKVIYLVNTEKTKIAKLATTTPGVHTIQLQNNRVTTITVTAATNFTFKHGFSILKPESLSETSTQPISGKESYIALYLETNNTEVMLTSLELKEHGIILKLEQKDEDKQLYISESFVPLNKPFTLTVTGYTDGKEEIVRLGPTTIQKQDDNCSATTAVVPLATILGGPKLIVLYGDSLVIKCKLHAFPRPDVIWRDSDGNFYGYSTTVPVELPYIYMNALNLTAVKRNFSISCMPLNTKGEGQDLVHIQTKPKTFLKIIKSPENITIPFGETKDIELSVSADPSVNVTWYKENTPIYVDEDYGIAQSGNTSVLTIKNMYYNKRGNFSVRVTNGYHVIKITFKVSILAEIPEIDKSVSVKTVAKGSDVILNCSLLRGHPKPKIFWSYENNKDVMQLRNDDGELYKLTKVVKDDTGSYKCRAENDLGHDYHQIDLLVQYPPEIKGKDEHVTAVQNKKKDLNCTVIGEPVPSVKWFKNNVEIESTLTGNYRTYRNNNTLRFTASLEDNAMFTCNATNILGSAYKNIHVKVLTYVRIDPPERSVLNVDIGTPEVKLICNAHGFPRPQISWASLSFDRKIKRNLSADADNGITISPIQIEDEGWYVCQAKNIIGYTTIAYEIHVTEVPAVKSIDSKFTGIEGDLVLRVPCEAKGHPKPTITWMKEEDNVALGTDWYDMEECGTLLIKNLSKGATGTYKCIAENVVGYDSKEFSVTVESYPAPENVSTEIIIEEGTSAYIPCDLRQFKTDIVRWFMGEKLIHKGELTLSNVTTSDSGVYICRLSNFLYSQSVHKRIIVGPKPKFINDLETEIDYYEGSTVSLKCDVTSDSPVTVQWFHNDHLINETSMQIVRQLKFFDIGKYTCDVSNVFGTNSRTFNILLRECVFYIDNDFNRQQPLLLNSRKHWITLNNYNGYVRIPKGDSVYLGCPENKMMYKDIVFHDQVTADCVDKTILKIQGEHVDFKELKCFKNNVPMRLTPGVSCGREFENNELMTIGFSISNITDNDMPDEFLGVYDVCFDRDMEVPIYVKHTLYHTLANNIPKALMATSFVEEHSDEDVDFQYECDSKNECCYTKRELVSSRMVLPGFPQLALDDYFTTVAHWSTCGTKNWDEIENRVQLLSHSLKENLEVWTGSSWPLHTSNKLSAITETLSNILDMTEPVSPYIWKVVQNQKENEALAIIQINVELNDLLAAVELITCRDMCNEVDWMRHTEWHNVDNGFIFCCTIDDFKFAFGFEKEFKDVQDVLLAQQ